MGEAGLASRQLVERVKEKCRAEYELAAAMDLEYVVVVVVLVIIIIISIIIIFIISIIIIVVANELRVQNVNCDS